jgi:hypothetical protein
MDVSLDLQCLDRLYLHGYLAKLQAGGQVIQFLSRVRGSSASPAGVSVTVRRSRSNRRVPRTRSRALICCDNDGPAMRSRAAARPKLSSPATAAK